MDRSSHQLSLAERRRQWAEEPKGAVGAQGPQPGAGLLQAQRPGPPWGGGGHMNLKEGNSGQAAEQGTQHRSLPGGSQPCTSRCGSTSLAPGASVLSPAEWGQSPISSIPSNRAPTLHFSISDWDELSSCGTDSSHRRRFYSRGRLRHDSAWRLDLPLGMNVGAPPWPSAEDKRRKGAPLSLLPLWRQNPRARPAAPGGTEDTSVERQEMSGF